MSVYVLNWPNLLCQIVCKWQTPLEELCKKLQIRFRISDTSAGYSNQNGEDSLKMIMDRWSQMKTDFDIIDLQLYIASFGPEVWIFPMFQIEIWQMAGSFWLFKSPLHFHFKLYKISDFLLLNKFFLILLLAPDRQSYNNPTILHNNHTQQEAGYYMVEMDLIWWGFRSAHTCECSPSFSTTRHFCYITRWPQNFKYLNADSLWWEKL